MICVLETNSMWEAQTVVAALRDDGIETFLDGVETARIAGVSIPRVLRVMVLDPARTRQARHIVDKTLRESPPMGSRDDIEPQRLPAIVKVGLGLAAIAVLVVIATLLTGLLAR
jgi:hypothetical protein